MSGEAALVPAVWIAVCGGSTGALSMFLYGWLSPQSRLVELSAQLARTRIALNRAENSDLSTIWSLTKQATGLSLQQIKLILGPTLCAALPALALAYMVGLVADLSHLSIAPAWKPSWLFSGHVAFWVPLAVSGLAVKWAYGIK